MWDGQAFPERGGGSRLHATPSCGTIRIRRDGIRVLLHLDMFFKVLWKSLLCTKGNLQPPPTFSRTTSCTSPLGAAAAASAARRTGCFRLSAIRSRTWRQEELMGRVGRMGRGYPIRAFTSKPSCSRSTLRPNWCRSSVTPWCCLSVMFLCNAAHVEKPLQQSRMRASHSGSRRARSLSSSEDKAHTVQTCDQLELGWVDCRLVDMRRTKERNTKTRLLAECGAEEHCLALLGGQPHNLPHLQDCSTQTAAAASGAHM